MRRGGLGGTSLWHIAPLVLLRSSILSPLIYFNTPPHRPLFSNLFQTSPLSSLEMEEKCFFFCRCRARLKLRRSSIYWFRLFIPTHENKVKQKLRCLPSNNTNSKPTQNKTTATKTTNPQTNRTPRKKSETLRFQKSLHASQYSSAMK